MALTQIGKGGLGSTIGIGTNSPDRSLHVAGTEPSIVFEKTDESTDLKTFRIFMNSSALQIGTVDDAFSAGVTAIEITRDNTDAITSINIRSEGGATTTSLQQGLAKTWHRFTEETTTATRDSFNVSSITDSGTGETVTTFSNNMSNANYASASMATQQGDNRGGCWICYNRGNTGTGNLPTTSTLETQAYAGGTASLDPVAQDLDEASVIIHGDLA